MVSDEQTDSLNMTLESHTPQRNIQLVLCNICFMNSNLCVCVHACVHVCVGEVGRCLLAIIDVHSYLTIESNRNYDVLMRICTHHLLPTTRLAFFFACTSSRISPCQVMRLVFSM